MIKQIAYIIFTALIFSLNLQSQALFQPNNLNFEKGMDGAKPPFWNTARKLEDAGMTVVSSATNPYEGNLCVKLENPHPIADDQLDENALPAYQILDAIPYRNKTIRLTAFAKTELKSKNARGELWAIGRSTKEQITISEYQEKNPISNRDWKKHEITLHVPDETNELRVGILLKGQGKLWADDFKIEIIQPEGSLNETVKNLSERELENFKALANIYGYLHYFNPANDLSTSKDENVTFWAIQNAEKAKNDKELMTFLNQYSKMLSPVSSVTKSVDDNFTYIRPEGSIDNMALTKMYLGGHVERSDELFTAQTVNVFASLRQREASAVQIIEAIKLKNKKVKISASIKVNQASPGANAQIWAKADRINSTEYVLATNAESPAMSSAWRRYEISITLPEDVFNIKLALVFIGEGKAYFDDIKIESFDNDNKVTDIDVLNQGFESISEDGFAKFWGIENEVLQAGYRIYADSIESTKGRYSLVMESDLANRVSFPIIGKVHNYRLSENIYLNMPLVYFGNNDGTLPKIDDPKIKVSGKPDGYNSSIDDRYSRIASVIKLWNMLKHFSPVKIEQSVIDSVLNNSLVTASKTESSSEFLSLLRSMLLLTNDARAVAWSQDIDYEYTFPFLLRRYSGKTLVNGLADTTLGISFGDELIMIDGKNIEDILKEKFEYIAGEQNNYKYIKALAEIRAGKRDSESDLTFKSKGGNTYQVKAKRNTLMQNVMEPRPAAIVEIDTGNVYIDLTEINDEILKDYIETLSTMNAFIFDLRGFSSVSEHFLSLLSTDSISNSTWQIPVYTFPDKEKISYKNFGGGKIRGYNKLAGKKYVFLIDEKTTGYAEALVSIVKENKLGTVIGMPTSGYAAESIAVRLFGGYAVSFAGLNVYTPKGKHIFGSSSKPDIEINYELPESNFKYDNILLESLKLLKN